MGGEPLDMTEHEISRTLVKSPPELWVQCSEADSLARHLEGFGEIRITRLEPETAVAWEGEQIRGTVRLEPSGWGTKVILTAQGRTAEPAPSVSSAQAGNPGRPNPRRASKTEPTEATPGTLLGRLLRLVSLRGGPTPTPAPAREARPPIPQSPHPATEQLVAALESLGQAHRRPFSHS